jgi:hypothetical protein
MELVQGVPITTYCDGNRLSTRERLDLFADVCRAIHHAHEKGIIHRDIKPSNVMVTLHDGTPVPKIIDFGVAKATNQRLTEKTLFTAYGQFVGTPAYMSPEQAEMSGLEIDRRSDIYSLGVLLYELLTGTTPFDAETLRTRGFLEIMRVIREEDPPTPSGRLSTLGDRLIEVAGRRQVEPHALQRLIRGDLDWIVMKAIDKDRRRRYGSAPEFLDDVTRYFRDEPVTARPPSAGYRFGKFAKRHHGQVVAAGVIAVVVVGSALAQVAGVFTSSASESAIPSRRLFLDRLNVTRAVPTQDGRHVLQYNPERGGLELVDVGSGQPTLLSRTVGPAPLIKDVSGPDPRFFHYALAPDRKQISVVHWISSENDRQPSPERDGGLELRLHQVGGEGDGRLLTRWPEPGYHIQVFGWSPDRARVWVFVMRPDRAAEIVSVAVADGARQVLRTLAWRSHTQRPSLSPDGRLITYHDAQRPQDAPDIFLLGTDGSAPIRIEHPANDSKPIFTPDGSGVVFHSDRTGGGLWFLPVVNGRPAGEPRLVWADVGPFGVANVFADNGSLIYYFAITGWEIYTAPIDLGRGIVGTPEHLVPLRGEMNNAPAFSPDGQSLGYLRDRGRRLVLRNLATSVEREFPIAGSLLAPGLAYCPDGRSAIVSGSEQGGSVVYRVNLDRGGAERLPIETSSVACLADGHDIIYLRSTLRRDPPIACNGARDQVARWSGDHRRDSPLERQQQNCVCRTA